MIMLVQRCARDLPKEFIISLHVERGSVWVNLENSDDFSIEYGESPDDTPYESMEKALAFAIEFAKKHP